MKPLKVIDWDVASTEYLEVDVEADGGVVDPTGFPVAFAFIVGTAKPASADWHAGSWRTLGPQEYVAQCLVGPGTGGVALAVNVYTIWTKVTATPEVPIRETGLLNVQ